MFNVAKSDEDPLLSYLRHPPAFPGPEHWKAGVQTWLLTGAVLLIVQLVGIADFSTWLRTVAVTLGMTVFAWSVAILVANRSRTKDTQADPST